jgi:hypothetical protein
MDKQDDVDSRAGPDDQSGGGEASLSVSRGKIYFAFSGFQVGSEEKLALTRDGC